MILCQYKCSEHLGRMHLGIPHQILPDGQTNARRGRILSFQQASNETIPEAWERHQEYILACPHHGIMDNWLIL